MTTLLHHNYITSLLHCHLIDVGDMLRSGLEDVFSWITSILWIPVNFCRFQLSFISNFFHNFDAFYASYILHTYSLHQLSKDTIRSFLTFLTITDFQKFDIHKFKSNFGKCSTENYEQRNNDKKDTLRWMKRCHNECIFKTGNAWKIKLSRYLYCNYVNYILFVLCLVYAYLIFSRS